MRRSITVALVLVLGGAALASPGCSIVTSHHE